MHVLGPCGTNAVTGSKETNKVFLPHIYHSTQIRIIEMYSTYHDINSISIFIDVLVMASSV